MEDEKKPSWLKRFKAWIKEKRQIWLRRNIIKKIAKLTPVGPEIDYDTFMGNKPAYTGSHASMEEYARYFGGRVVENGQLWAISCPHSKQKIVTYPQKIEYNDGSTTQIQVIGNEECQRAFKELMYRQMFPERNVVCPHCKDAE